jgi:hypothetical protein
MHSTIKYLALGLVIGVALAALVAILVYSSAPRVNVDSSAGPAVALHDTPSSTPSPPAMAPGASITPAFTPLPTSLPPSPAPTATLPPTSTPGALQLMLDSGSLVFAGPLTNSQQLDLYRSSLNYIGLTPEFSRRIAEEINGVGYGDPSNICGPLAIAILRDAGLISPGVAPHDFWLLNPLASADVTRLNEVFPFDSYMYFKTLTPINKMDWRDSPLLPGDFLFIWHGSGGNFDHMLVVSRVDKDARTYAVTNYGTAEGFVIGETLLYDPNDPTAGLFHTWTQERNAILGSTGFGGFELWRRRSP